MIMVTHIGINLLFHIIVQHSEDFRLSFYFNFNTRWTLFYSTYYANPATNLRQGPY